MTIHHLELSAAVLAVKVDKMLRSELQLEGSQFWTDSTAVLKYIKKMRTKGSKHLL